MRITGFLIFASFFCLAACRSRDALPPGILPEPKMEAVMWDLIRVDQYLNNYIFPKDSSLNHKQESIRRYRQVMLLHQTNQEQFRKSFAYYQSHPVLFKTILDSLNLHKDSVSNKIVKPGFSKDSAGIKGFKSLPIDTE